MRYTTAQELFYGGTPPGQGNINQKRSVAGDLSTSASYTGVGKGLILKKNYKERGACKRHLDTQLNYLRAEFTIALR